MQLARIQVFRRGGSTKWGCQRRRPSRGSPGASFPGKFLIFKSSETRFLPFWGKVSVFYIILFHKNITKLRKNMQIFINKTMMKIYCISSYFNFVFRQRRVDKKHSSGLNHSIVVNELFVVNVHQSWAWQSFRCHGGTFTVNQKCIFFYGKNVLALLRSRGLTWIWTFCI